MYLLLAKPKVRKKTGLLRLDGSVSGPGERNCRGSERSKGGRWHYNKSEIVWYRVRQNHRCQSDSLHSIRTFIVSKAIWFGYPWKFPPPPPPPPPLPCHKVHNAQIASQAKLCTKQSNPCQRRNQKKYVHTWLGLAYCISSVWNLLFFGSGLVGRKEKKIKNMMISIACNCFFFFLKKKGLRKGVG